MTNGYRRNLIVTPQRNLISVTALMLFGSLLGISGHASGQVIPLTGNSSPAMQATAAQSGVPSGHPTQVTDSAGRAFAASYDSAGRLSALKATAGRNIADMRVGYDSNGRIQMVRFDNRYQLLFRYPSDGTEEVTDPLGGRIVRVSTGGAFVAQTSADPSGALAETLRRLESLFTRIQPVSGLNAVPAANMSP
jgi:YD repeat-containing protein